MKRRRFKTPDRQRMYDHYRVADIKRNILASDRRMYWWGRYGATAKQARIDRDMHGYPCWAAGYDRFLDEGAPNFEILANAGRCTLREAIDAARRWK